MPETVQMKSSRSGYTARLVGVLAVLAVACSGALAQARGIGTPPPPDVQHRIVALASAKLATGEASFARGDFEHARAVFDDAVDAFLDSGFDLRSDPELMKAYRETVAKVNLYTTIGVNAEGDSVWPLQAYEATSDDFRLEDMPTSEDLASAGDLEDAKFLVRVAELQRRFQEKFGRTFTLTGRDTPVHSRLYGHGRAVDVRVHDLAAAHVQFIVQNGRALRMRALDFSSAERVASHNMRVISMGRPLDTLSTGVHLHLNDSPRSDRAYVEKPATKSSVRAAIQNTER
ncbi:MAG: hypothetical protein IPF82_14555 [Blastocatellia bacterium]|nr:hypothetical protein [Blastocatellia bacterium]